jgi:hypothetical protein
MIRAILDGTKTQTRRVAPVSSLDIQEHDEGMVTWRVAFSKPIKGTLASYSGGKFSTDQACRIVASQFSPYGQPGDRLWVRETWQGPLFDYEQWDDYHADRKQFETPKHCVYAADGGPVPEFATEDDEIVQRWRPSIHMPRWASRITLEVTGVRIERLKDVSEADALAEGIVRLPDGGFGLPAGEHYHLTDPRESYWSLWEAIHGPGSVEADPWVWVVEFKRLEAA